MPISINVAGVWKTDDLPEINVASVWKEPDAAEVNVAGVWYEAHAGLAVSASIINVRNFLTSGTCFAGVRYNSVGTEYSCTNSGAFTTSRGNWLDAGDSSEVWIERTVNTGSLNWNDPGAGRHQMSTTRTFGVSRSIPGKQSANITVDFYDAASGGNLLDSATYEMDAEQGVL
jgi:hypothetical protein